MFAMGVAVGLMAMMAIWWLSSIWARIVCAQRDEECEDELGRLEKLWAAHDVNKDQTGSGE